MKKIIVAVAATLGMLASGAPAFAGGDTFPAPDSAQACPDSGPSLQILMDGCRVPAYSDTDAPTIHFLFSSVNLLVQHTAALNATIAERDATISALRDKVARKNAVIERLREKLAHAH